MQQTQERVARFSELRPSRQAFLDTRIPEHVRDIYNVIGKGVTEHPELKPAITAAEGFNITYVGAERRERVVECVHHRQVTNPVSVRNGARYHPGLRFRRQGWNRLS